MSSGDGTGDSGGGGGGGSSGVGPTKHKSASTKTQLVVVGVVLSGLDGTVIGRIGAITGGGVAAVPNVLALSPNPEAVPTRIVPFVAPAGTVAVSSVGDTDRNWDAGTPLKVTAVGVSRL